MIEFTKMHGNGNDFLVINETQKTLVKKEDKPSFSIKYCDRRFGVGGDGILFLQKTNEADFLMRLFNSDGSEADMCGNGIRCAAKYAKDNDLVKDEDIEIKTGAGVLEVETRVDEEFWAKVDMGKPQFERKNIPVKGNGKFLKQDLEGYEISAVNTGVPHSVVFVETLEEVNVEEEAPKIRHHDQFPNGINVNFVEIYDEDNIGVRTFERGVEAETLSCGTGSVASAAISRELEKTKGREVFVETQGGDLRILFEDNTAYMEGPAETVFEGKILDTI
ncbi:diaminopimelate epimerase [archaeon SCG-AAA382B04]|nr:diaminopimelate epimerase [archaeon SCG-AAA382B04]